MSHLQISRYSWQDQDRERKIQVGKAYNQSCYQQNHSTYEVLELFVIVHPRIFSKFLFNHNYVDNRNKNKVYDDS